MASIESIRSSYSDPQKIIHTSFSGAFAWAIVVGGRKVTLLHFLGQMDAVHATGFGALVKAVAIVSTPLFSKLTHKLWLNSLMAHALGGSIGYGISYGLASLGYLALPIPVTSAIAITISLFVLALFFPPKGAKVIYDDGSFYEGTWVNGQPFTGKTVQNYFESNGDLRKTDIRKFLTSTHIETYTTYPNGDHLRKTILNGKIITLSGMRTTPYGNVEEGDFDVEGKTLRTGTVTEKAADGKVTIHSFLKGERVNKEVLVPAKKES